jgi:hypothetical protein
MILLEREGRVAREWVGDVLVYRAA